MNISSKWKICYLACLIAFTLFGGYAYAELSEVEKEVIWFVEMCEQQASVGEHTEGMSSTK